MQPQPGRGEQWPGEAGIRAGEGMQCRGPICGPAQLWHIRLAPSSPELGSCFQEQGCSPPCCTGLGLQPGPTAHTAEQVRSTQETQVTKQSGSLRARYLSAALCFPGPSWHLSVQPSGWGWGRQCCGPGPGPPSPPGPACSSFLPGGSWGLPVLLAGSAASSFLSQHLASRVWMASALGKPGWDQAESPWDCSKGHHGGNSAWQGRCGSHFPEAGLLCCCSASPTQRPSVCR